MQTLFSNNIIAVLYYNKAELTCRCVASVLQSGYPESRILLFDNGSNETDARKIRRAFPDCRHGTNSKNRGFAGGFNAALKQSFFLGGQAVLFLTNDTIVSPGILEDCLDTAEKTGASMVAPQINYLNQRERVDSAGAFFSPETFSLHHYRRSGLPALLHPPFDYIPGTALWIDRNTFSRLNGADESFFTYWEDADLSVRAFKAGIRQARTSGAKIFHGIGRTCHKKTIYTTWYFQRNRILFCRRHLTGPMQQKALTTIIRELKEMLKKTDSSRQAKRDYLEKLIGFASES